MIFTMMNVYSLNTACIVNEMHVCFHFLLYKLVTSDIINNGINRGDKGRLWVFIDYTYYFMLKGSRDYLKVNVSDVRLPGK